jgi:pSer/pThr/pTyr-binding forkhead associated (FHA) protein
VSNAVKIYKHFQTPKSSGVYHRLICLTGDKKGVAYFIMNKQRVVMGRSETADIRVLDLKSSREHAEIIQVGDDYVLTDLGSQNGIIVNDLKIKQHVLSDGDKIIIGKTVYKFSEIEVKEAKEEIDPDIISEVEEDPEDVARDKKLAKVLIIVLILAFVLFGLEDEDVEEVGNTNQKEQTAFNVVEVQIKNGVKRKNKKNKKNKEKLQRYFQRGLREFREGNYFRARAEFENAKQWDPRDPTANFYLRKTIEKQNETIAGYFSKASRDVDALNYKAATNAYCTIVRLLVHHIPDDERISQARQSLRQIEKKNNADENSIICIRKDNDE